MPLRRIFRWPLFDLGDPRTERRAGWLVPLAFGLASLKLGVDANWDLLNYHLYGPFALLHGKLQVDLAPAGLQTYFNPLLDLPYYFATQWLPAPLLAFAMGALHGVAFPLLVTIASRLLPLPDARERRRMALLLAAAGVVGPDFLSQFGTTMGDDTTALLVLAALAVLLRGPHAGEALHVDARSAVLAGLLAGLATGLKLTNAMYAIGLVAALCVTSDGGRAKGRNLVACAAAALLGWALTGGWWHARMALVFGNPFFPQFGALFPNDLALPVMVADQRWHPRSLIEQVLWPFIFSWNPSRVTELPERQLLWPVLYVATLAWAAVRPPRFRARTAVLLAFLAAAYLAWLEVFGVYRYLVAAELLAPLAMFAVLQAILPARAALRAVGVVLAASLATTFLSGFYLWDRHSLAWQAASAEVPPLPAPARTTVFLVTEDKPWAWLATLFPPEVAFVQLRSSMPEGPAFAPRVRAIAREREMLFAVADAVAVKPGTVPGSDAAARDRQSRDLVAAALGLYGFVLDASACRVFEARIGRGRHPYQWCRVRPRND